jgi:hypothetical protein
MNRKDAKYAKLRRKKGILYKLQKFRHKFSNL